MQGYQSVCGSTGSPRTDLFRTSFRSLRSLERQSEITRYELPYPCNIVQIQYRDGWSLWQRRIRGNRDDGLVLRVKQRLAERRAMELNLGERHVPEALDQNQVGMPRFEARERPGEIGLGRVFVLGMVNRWLLSFTTANLFGAVNCARLREVG